MASTDLNTDETRNLISADKVEGTTIYNRSKENIGKIHKVMINKRTGKVAYVVVQYGGLMGVGSDYYPMPWNVLDYDTSYGGYVVDMTKERLQNAPHYAGSSEPNWFDRSYNEQVH